MLGRPVPAADAGLTPDAVGRLHLAELTVLGAGLLVAGWGFPSQGAQRVNALVGGGPAASFGRRAELLRHLTHTVETNGIVVDLILEMRRLGAGAGAIAVTWRSAAACARGPLRPDGYLMVETGQHAVGFFLEYDRGTENARGYRQKFAAYYAYLESRRWARDYQGFPTILVITSSPGAEGRIAKAIRTVSIGRGATVPVLLTLAGLIRGQVDSVRGPIWRDPWHADRRQWPVLMNRRHDDA